MSAGGLEEQVDALRQYASEHPEALAQIDAHLTSLLVELRYRSTQPDGSLPRVPYKTLDAWVIACEKLGRKPTDNEIAGWVATIAENAGTTIDRETARRKDLQVNFLNQNLLELRALLEELPSL